MNRKEFDALLDRHRKKVERLKSIVEAYADQATDVEVLDCWLEFDHEATQKAIGRLDGRLAEVKVALSKFVGEN